MKSIKMTILSMFDIYSLCTNNAHGFQLHVTRLPIYPYIGLPKLSFCTVV